MAHSTVLAPAPILTQFPWSRLADSKVLDLACGSGRNGLWFLAQGAEVTFIDQDLTSLSSLKHPKAHLLQGDLEDGNSVALAVDTFDIVLVFNYLHRPLMAQIAASVKPRGIIVYETFTWQQAEKGRPRNPDFLLTENELKSAFANWQPLHYFEGLLNDPLTGHANYKAQLIAQKYGLPPA